MKFLFILFQDYDVERDKYGRLSTGRNDRVREDRFKDQARSNVNRPILPSNCGSTYPGSASSTDNKFGNTYGLSTQFLESLGITGPLVTRIFVANVSFIFFNYHFFNFSYLLQETLLK